MARKEIVRLDAGLTAVAVQESNATTGGLMLLWKWKLRCIACTVLNSISRICKEAFSSQAQTTPEDGVRRVKPGRRRSDPLPAHKGTTRFEATHREKIPAHIPMDDVDGAYSCISRTMRLFPRAHAQDEIDPARKNSGSDRTDNRPVGDDGRANCQAHP